MPKEGISIFFTIKDSASAALASIGDKTKALDKETQQLAQMYNALQQSNAPLVKTQGELKAQLEVLRKQISDNRAEWKKYDSELARVSMNEAIAEQDELKRQLKDVENQISSNTKTLSEYRESIRKTELESGSAQGQTTLASLGKGLATGAVGEMLSSALGDALTSGLSSAIGVPTASLLSDSLSGIIAGATAGAVAGLPGIVIGGALGGISGALTGGTKIFEAKDDAFKDYYVGLYDTVNANTEEMISSGSTIAGGREQTFKAFAKRLGGDEEAKNFLEDVKTMAAGTNYDYDEITGYSKLLLNSYDSEAALKVLQSLSDATAGLDLTSSDVSVMISGLSRMRTTGKATQEYLNYFSERGVDVYEALSGFAGGDKSKVAEKVSEGEIVGEDAAQAILDYIDQEYGGLSEDLKSTYDALSANLEDIMSNLDAAAGEGYNEMRKSGLSAEIEAYDDALGEALEEVNRISGENKAYMENLSEQYTREALGALLLGEEAGSFSEEDQGKLEAMRAEYQTASEAYANGSQEAGLTMERLREDAEALAIAAYESSEQYRIYMDEQLDQIEAIRENTAGLEAATNAYLMSQEKSKGMMATETGQEKVSGFLNFLGIVGEAAENAAYGSSSFGTAGFGYSGAYGFESIPYDNFPAVLHEGERVLTASQARAQDRGGGDIHITVTGNSFQGTGEEMADQIAGILVRKLEWAAIAAEPR